MRFLLALFALTFLASCATAGPADENARAALALVMAQPLKATSGCPCGPSCPLGGDCGAGCPCVLKRGPSQETRATRAADGWSWCEEDGGYWWRYRQQPASVQVYQPAPVYATPSPAPVQSFAPTFAQPSFSGFRSGGCASGSCGRGG